MTLSDRLRALVERAAALEEQIDGTVYRIALADCTTDDERDAAVLALRH